MNDIKDKNCCRCKEKAKEAWLVPGIEEKKYVCKKCFLMLVELMLRYTNDREWQFKMLKLEEKLERRKKK